MTTVGQPCTISGGELFVNFSLPRDFQFRLPAVAALKNGPALLKVEALPSGYSCQPSVASAEASYFLNRYRLFVEQGGRRYVACEPLGRCIEDGEDSVLSMIGQYASMAADSEDNKMIFCSVAGPKPMPGLDDAFNAGVRLRDGGARYPILSRGTGSKARKSFKLPALTFQHAIFGDFASMRKIQTLADGEATREVPLRAKELPPGQQDLVLRVVDHSRGMYTELEHVFRERGSFEPIAEDEWKPFGAHMVDEWVVNFFLNMARQSYGRHDSGDMAGLDL